MLYIMTLRRCIATGQYFFKHSCWVMSHTASYKDKSKLKVSRETTLHHLLAQEQTVGHLNSCVVLFNI